MEKQITAKIMQIFKTESDELTRMLKIIELTQKRDVNKILEIYRRIKNGEIKIVSIVSSIELDSKKRKTLEKKISEKLDTELVFDYEVNESLKGGIEIKIGDNIFNLQ